MQEAMQHLVFTLGSSKRILVVSAKARCLHASLLNSTVFLSSGACLQAYSSRSAVSAFLRNSLPPKALFFKP